jgi:hypothetical protein
VKPLDFVVHKMETKKLTQMEIEEQLIEKLRNITLEKDKLIKQMIMIKERYNQIIEDEELCKTMIMHQYSKANRSAYMMSKIKELRDKGILHE